MTTQLTIRSCPNCGSDQITKVCRDWYGQYRSAQYVIADLEFYECPVCGERVFDVDAMRQIRFYSPAYARREKTTSKVPAIAVLA